MDEPLGGQSAESSVCTLPQEAGPGVAREVGPVTVNAQLNHLDQSLHVHQAVTLPDPEAAERLQKLYPNFMSEVMEARKREQRARLMRERRAQETEFAVVQTKIQNEHQQSSAMLGFEHQRFNAVISVVVFIAIIFALCGIVTLFRGMYWPAGGMGVGMACAFSQLVKLLKASR